MLIADCIHCCSILLLCLSAPHACDNFTLRLILSSTLLWIIAKICTLSPGQNNHEQNIEHENNYKIDSKIFTASHGQNNHQQTKLIVEREGFDENFSELFAMMYKIVKETASTTKLVYETVYVDMWFQEHSYQGKNQILQANVMKTYRRKLEIWKYAASNPESPHYGKKLLQEAEKEIKKIEQAREALVQAQETLNAWTPAATCYCEVQRRAINSLESE